MCALGRSVLPLSRRIRQSAMLMKLTEEDFADLRAHPTRNVPRRMPAVIITTQLRSILAYNVACPGNPTRALSKFQTIDYSVDNRCFRILRQILCRALICFKIRSIYSRYVNGLNRLLVMSEISFLLIVTHLVSRFSCIGYD